MNLYCFVFIYQYKQLMYTDEAQLSAVFLVIRYHLDHVYVFYGDSKISLTNNSRSLLFIYSVSSQFFCVSEMFLNFMDSFK